MRSSAFPKILPAAVGVAILAATTPAAATPAGSDDPTATTCGAVVHIGEADDTLADEYRSVGVPADQIIVTTPEGADTTAFVAAITDVVHDTETEDPVPGGRCWVVAPTADSYDTTAPESGIQQVMEAVPYSDRILWLNTGDDEAVATALDTLTDTYAQTSASTWDGTPEQAAQLAVDGAIAAADNTPTPPAPTATTQPTTPASSSSGSAPTVAPAPAADDVPATPTEPAETTAVEAPTAPASTTGFNMERESGGGTVRASDWVADEVYTFDIRSENPPFLDGAYIDAWLTEKYSDSPLIGHGDKIIEMSEQTGISAGFALGNWAKETTFGRSQPGAAPHFNFGCMTAPTVEGFDSVNIANRDWASFGSAETGIEEWFKYVKRGYVDEGKVSYKDFLDKYSPESDNNDHSLFGNIMWGVLDAVGYDLSEQAPIMG